MKKEYVSPDMMLWFYGSVDEVCARAGMRYATMNDPGTPTEEMAPSSGNKGEMW